MQVRDQPSAHELRLSEQLDKVMDHLDKLQDQPATTYNRLLQLKWQFKQELLLASWYCKDPDETLEGMQMLQQERNQRAYWEQCYRHITAIINNWDRYQGVSLDLSTVEGWLQGPPN